MAERTGSPPFWKYRPVAPDALIIGLMLAGGAFQLWFGDTAFERFCAPAAALAVISLAIMERINRRWAVLATGAMCAVLMVCFIAWIFSMAVL